MPASGGRRRWRLVVVESGVCVSAAMASGVRRGDGVRCVPAERSRRVRGCIFGCALHNRCVLHRAQRPSNASHRWRRMCARAAYGQQMDLHPEIFASSVARRAFQTTPLHMRCRNASMRLCSDAELQRIGVWRWDRRCACRNFIARAGNRGARRGLVYGSYGSHASSDRIKPNKKRRKRNARSTALPRANTIHSLTYTHSLSVRRRRRPRTPRPPPLPRRVAHAALVDDERRGADRPH